MLKQLLNFLLPINCLFCYRSGSYLCLSCRQQLLEANYDEISLANVNRLVIAYRYNRGIELLWHYAKHQGYYTIANFLGELLLAAILARDREFISGAYLTPIPLARQKQRQRGFNQILKLYDGMQLVSARVNVNLELLDCLLRITDTKTQIGQNQAQRRKNLAGKFSLKPGSKLPRRVVLLDDVTTTGATLSECAKILKQAGVEQVDALVFARG